jgi:hypothetical protein
MYPLHLGETSTFLKEHKGSSCILPMFKMTHNLIQYVQHVYFFIVQLWILWKLNSFYYNVYIDSLFKWYDLMINEFDALIDHNNGKLTFGY